MRRGNYKKVTKLSSHDLLNITFESIQVPSRTKYFDTFTSSVLTTLEFVTTALL